MKMDVENVIPGCIQEATALGLNWHVGANGRVVQFGPNAETEEA